MIQNKLTKLERISHEWGKYSGTGIPHNHIVTVRKMCAAGCSSTQIAQEIGWQKTRQALHMNIRKMGFVWNRRAGDKKVFVEWRK